MTYLSPFFTARVFIPETSEPASGSVRQKEASFGSSASMPRYFFLVSSEPPRHDGRRGEAVGHQTGADARAAPAHLLLDQAAGEVVETGPAVGLGDVGVHQPDLPSLVDDVLGPGAVLVVLPGDLADLFLREVVRQLAQILLLVGQSEVNHWSKLLFVVRVGEVAPIDWSVNQAKRRICRRDRRPWMSGNCIPAASPQLLGRSVSRDRPLGVLSGDGLLAGASRSTTARHRAHHIDRASDRRDRLRRLRRCLEADRQGPVRDRAGRRRPVPRLHQPPTVDPRHAGGGGPADARGEVLPPGAAGKPALDVEAELRRYSAATPGIRAGPPATRSSGAAGRRPARRCATKCAGWSIIRNERRVREGQPPLDVEAETERQLADFIGSPR